MMYVVCLMWMNIHTGTCAFRLYAKGVVCLMEVARRTFDTRLDVDDRKGIHMHFILKGTFRIFVNRGFILRYILDFMVRYVIVKNTYFSELKGESVLYAVLNSR